MLLLKGFFSSSFFFFFWPNFSYLAPSIVQCKGFQRIVIVIYIVDFCIYSLINVLKEAGVGTNGDFLYKPENSVTCK